MSTFCSLIKNTWAYKAIKNEKEENKLSHAYLICCGDKDSLEQVAKIFASLLSCEKNEPCGECRACKLIEKKAHPDVIFYPKGEKDVVVEDVNNLIEESVLKPIEQDKKVFVILNADDMNARAQNKLLKTLEEPPKDVYVLMVAKNDFNLLSTVKSRVKKFEISPFSAQEIIQVLEKECNDLERLQVAVSCGDGTVGKARALYLDDNLLDCYVAVKKVLLEMKTSADLLKYSGLVSSLRCGLDEFLSVLELTVRDMLVIEQGRVDLVLNKQNLENFSHVEGYSAGALIYIQEKILQAKKRKKFNANAQMLIEWILFQILEGKYKWRKL